MSERWTWVILYVVVMLLAVILAAVLGEMALFKTTKLGKSGLNAARIVQFFGYGGALFVLWLTARRAALLLPKDGYWQPVKSLLLPLATLIVVAVGQAVLLMVVGPLMSKDAQNVYNWIAVVAIIASAAWLLGALLTGSSSLAPLFSGHRTKHS